MPVIINKPFCRDMLALLDLVSKRRKRWFMMKELVGLFPETCSDLGKFFEEDLYFSSIQNDVIYLGDPMIKTLRTRFSEELKRLEMQERSYRQTQITMWVSVATLTVALISILISVLTAVR